MTLQIEQWRKQLSLVLQEFSSQVSFDKETVMVIGCSTSEVVGERIGTAGTLKVAKMIFDELKAFAEEHQVKLAFQCCEHLNRALVIEKETAALKDLEEVAVIPVQTAGGALAAYAYEHLRNPVVVEYIKADAGIDIGDTFIGMHLKHVAVPVRVSIKDIGDAHVTLVKTRPKLIGGARAVYEQTEATNSCSS
ncbi:TIGR01440 family protein [Bacillus chungangensis]|uniref:UPF0340 protein J2S08_003431 n=1 Tax=Bacillus chungangensis TaxID=587633 RepID=A0ABT9WW74_9BACI|nr:TIGR01440 family protein [Bacillus chungangensis]MDQ0177551.1 uncharacterized protein (TIGR01440 family) [Bacillus chungangensis]